MTSAVPTSTSPSPRQRILEAAHDLFYAEGIRATGVDRVIEAAKVTKVTFYRQFPSKDDLVDAYLGMRHDRWTSWLRSSLEDRRARKTGGVDAIAEVLRGWWEAPSFRGCAFINAATELGPASPRILEVYRKHKEAMEGILLEALGKDRRGPGVGEALVVAVDGAILQAQAGVPLDRVEAALRRLLESCSGGRRASRKT